MMPTALRYLPVDVETAGGFDPRLPQAELRIVSAAGEIVDLRFGSREEALNLLDSDSVFVAHNAQYDLDWLAEQLGYHHRGPVFDTMVAFQMWANGRKESAALDNVAKKILGVELNKSFQKAPWDGLLFDDQLEYAIKDTQILEPLRERLWMLLQRAGLKDLFTLEMALLPVLHEMKQRGVRLDVPVDETGNNLARRVMEVKKLLKKASTVEKQLLGFVRSDGRIHPSFGQTFTETGRLNSRDPNLQNQDRGPDVRGLFVPAEGHKFVIADYSQLELRLAALLSGDEAMQAAYAAGRDLHSETCARIFGTETKATRTLSKNINFGLVFGGGHKTLVTFAYKSGVVIPEADALQYKQAFRQAYPTLYKWQQKQGNPKGTNVQTVLGRRKYIPAGEGYCERINYPVQGSAADGMKLAMVELHRKGITPLLSVHDEVVVEAPESEAEEVKQEVVETLVNAMYRASGQDPDNPEVAIEVEAGVANDWSEK
jgi:DNA polymerase I-like protein with 3'-5' exonuclease and polymerase domains